MDIHGALDSGVVTITLGIGSITRILVWQLRLQKIVFNFYYGRLLWYMQLRLV